MEDHPANDVIKYTIDDKSNIGDEKTVTFTDGSHSNIQR